MTEYLTDSWFENQSRWHILLKIPHSYRVLFCILSVDFSVVPSPLHMIKLDLFLDEKVSILVCLCCYAKMPETVWFIRCHQVQLSASKMALLEGRDPTVHMVEGRRTRVQIFSANPFIFSF